MLSLTQKIERKIGLESEAKTAFGRASACVVLETPEEYQIVVPILKSLNSRLRFFESEDRERLYLIPQRNCAESQDQFLWTFALPSNIDHGSVHLEQSRDLYLMHLPKVRLSQFRRKAKVQMGRLPAWQCLNPFSEAFSMNTNTVVVPSGLLH